MEEKNLMTSRHPGVFLPWEREKERIPRIEGDESIIQEVWENVDHLAWTFIWHILVSF